MRPTHFLGIDPGRNGAFGLINAAGTTAQTWEIPYRKRGETWEIDQAEALNRLKELRRLPSLLIALEWPSAWPGTFGNVARDAMTFGKGLATLDTLLFTLGDGMHRRVPPQQWKGKLGLVGKAWDKNSEQGHLLWLREYPNHAQAVLGPRGGLLDGPLDALLIAHWLRVESISPCGHKGGRRPPTIRGLGDDGQLAEWWNNHTQEHK